MTKPAMSWFRVYNTLLDDPKLQTLPAPLFRACMNLWCVANQQTPRGILPSVAAVAFALRMSETETRKSLAALETAGLLDKTPDGRYTPHNWAGRQFEGDNVSARVQRFRDTQRNVTRNVPGNGDATLQETPPEQSRAEHNPLTPVGGTLRVEGGAPEKRSRRRESAPDAPSPIPYAAPVDAERRAHYERQAELDGERRRAARAATNGAGVAVAAPAVLHEQVALSFNGGRTNG